MNNSPKNKVSIKSDFADPAIETMIEKGEIHVVCVAKNGLTALNVYAELCCNVKR